MGFPGGSGVKNLPANAGAIPGSGRSPGEGNDNHSSILLGRIPWTEEPGGLQSMGLQSQKRQPLNSNSISLGGGDRVSFIIFHELGIKVELQRKMGSCSQKEGAWMLGSQKE